jgi:acyl carrier protein
VDENAIRKNPALLNELGADSLDMAELIMELDEEFN